MSSLFESFLYSLIADVEAKIGRSLSETERSGLANAKSLMFLEAMSNGFYFAKSDEQIAAWLKEIDGFQRGDK